MSAAEALSDPFEGRNPYETRFGHDEMFEWAGRLVEAFELNTGESFEDAELSAFEMNAMLLEFTSALGRLSKKIPTYVMAFGTNQDLATVKFLVEQSANRVRQITSVIANSVDMPSVLPVGTLLCPVMQQSREREFGQSPDLMRILRTQSTGTPWAIADLRDKNRHDYASADTLLDFRMAIRPRFKAASYGILGCNTEITTAETYNRGARPVLAHLKWAIPDCVEGL